MNNTWWQQLSSRERSLVSALGVAVCLLLVYFIIWQPISNGVEASKQKVSYNRSLLSWMQKVTVVLQQNPSQNNSTQTTAADQRLAVVQASLKETSFNKHVTQIEETNQNDVQVSIKTADFDDLTDWLVLLWKQKGIIANELTLKKLNNQGMVSATIVLTGRAAS